MSVDREDTNDTEATPFYVAGGTVPIGSASYVMRQADEDLFAGLLRGEFCYVLTSRQMGKSSLMARTASRLREVGVTSAVVDLTAIGQDLDRETWYYSLLIEIARPLKMRQELKAFWTAEADLPPVQRWIAALRSTLQHRPDERLIIFIDEIDNVLALPFATGEFFAAIRACYNRRSEDPEFQRLTFCLLGVASHSDLINDARLTPFNIGRRIELNDFTAEEAIALEPGLGGEEIVRQAVLKRILYWTGGHPYLTQRLCRQVIECGDVISPAVVDAQCSNLFLASWSREQDDNLTFVRDRLLTSEQSEQDRVNLLRLYERICKRQRVPDNKADLLAGILRLSGVVRSADGLLQARNRIYAQVFDTAWVAAHLPDAELRRERAVFRRQLWRLCGVSAAVLTLLGALTYSTLLFRRQARDSERRERNNAVRAAESEKQAEISRSAAEISRSAAEKLLYVVNMNLAQQAFDKHEYGIVAEKLHQCLPQPGRPDLRGFEWRYFWRQMNQDLRTYFHRENHIVSSVVVSPDGKRIAAANFSGSIAVWNADKSTAPIFLEGHPDSATYLAFDPGSSNRLFSAGSDKTVRLWDIKKRQEIRTYKDPKEANGLNSGFHSLAFSPQGDCLAAGRNNGEIVLLNARTLEKMAVIQKPIIRTNVVASLPTEVNVLAFSRDGRWLAAGLNVGALKIYAMQPFPHHLFSSNRSFHVSGAGIESMAFSPDSAMLAVGRGNGPVELWNVRTWRMAPIRLTDHKDCVNGLAFSPDGKTLATGSWDTTVCLWDTATWTRKNRYIGHTNRVTSLAFFPDGTRLVSGGSNEVKIWDAKHWETNPETLPSYPIYYGEGHSPVSFSTNGAPRQLICDRIRKTVTLWNYATRKPTFLSHRPDVSAAALSPDGKTLATGSSQGQIMLSDITAGNTRPSLKVSPHNYDPRHADIVYMAFSPDGKLLAAASGDPALVTLWDTATGKRIAQFKHTNYAAGIAFSPDGKWLAIANWQGMVYLWDWQTGTKTSWRAHAKPVYDVAFSPEDGRTLATASGDGTIKLWNVATKQEMVTLQKHTPSVQHIAFSPDGNSLLAFGDGKTLLWRASGLAKIAAKDRSSGH